MHFAEAIYNFAEAICSFGENIDQLSPVEAGAGTELGNSPVEAGAGTELGNKNPYFLAKSGQIS